MHRLACDDRHSANVHAVPPRVESKTVTDPVMDRFSVIAQDRLGFIVSAPLQETCVLN
jgi:hypothetical protein